MDSSQVFDLLETIAFESGKNAKIQMLQNSKNEFLKKIFDYAYNPMRNYFVKQVEYPSVYGTVSFNEDTKFVWELLDSLSNREITGNTARVSITNLMSLMNEKSAELFSRIIRKDLRAGFSETTINRVYPNLIPEFPYMRMSGISESRKCKLFQNGDKEISQQKMDGMYCNLNIYTDGAFYTATMSSRSGNELPIEEYHQIVNSIKFTNMKLAAYQFHGELLVEVDGVIAPREIGNGILNSVNRGKSTFAPNQSPVFVAWDVVPLNFIKNKGKYEVPYIKRLESINDFICDSRFFKIVDTEFVSSMQEAIEHYQKMVSLGYEGTILKYHNAIWRDGASKEMFKLKLEADVDLRVISIEEGKKHTKNENRPAALLCASEDNLLQVAVVIKNEQMQDYIERNPDEYIDKIVTVRANSIMSPKGKNEIYSLFLPRLVETNYRMDKNVADSLEHIQQQFNDLISKNNYG